MGCKWRSEKGETARGKKGEEREGETGVQREREREIEWEREKGRQSRNGKEMMKTSKRRDIARKEQLS